jgi:histidinol-phosphate aminotransferase
MIQPRKTVQGLKAYIPPLEGRREFIRLDFNENTAGFPEVYGDISPDLMLYPEYTRFLNAYSELLGVPKERILLTNGSDEGLFTISFTFIEPGEDTALTAKPTFALIPYYLKLVQSRLIEIPCTPDFQYDTEKIEAALQTGIKLAMFASPDNPTGATLYVETIRQWCAAYPQTLFLIDEAYAEYTTESALPLTFEFDNLLVTRTFSKAWGMAGLRLGAVIGNPKLIDALTRVRSPYSVNSLAVSTALRLLEQQETILKNARDTIARKACVLQELEQRGYSVVPGQANFFLLKVGIQAKELSAFCRARGILVRDQSNRPELSGMVRVSVGTQEEMERFLAALDEFRTKEVLLFDMDGTLIDTSQSFDATVATLVEKYSGQPLPEEALQSLRAEGGFNDDWDATVELLRRRGVSKTYTEIAPEAAQLYISLAPKTETWLLEPDLLTRLSKRYRLGVVTGRCRGEFDPIWKEQFEPLFELVICQDDCANAAKKPAPDLLVSALRQLQAEGGIYVGNSVDDMQAALAAGLRPIGVTTTMTAERLREAKAEIILNSLDELGGLLMP